MPSRELPEDLQSRARTKGYTMPFVSENGMTFSDGGIGFTALIEPRSRGSVAEFAEKIGALAAVVARDAVPTLLELSLDTRAIVTGDKARVPIEWARGDEYLTGDLWYTVVAAWDRNVPRLEDLQRAGLVSGVEIFVPEHGAIRSDNAAAFFMKPLGARFLVNNLRSAIGASVVLVNKHPTSLQFSVELYRELSNSYANLKDSLLSTVTSISTVPGSLLDLVGGVSGGVASVFRGVPKLLPVVVIGALAFGGIWAYTKARKSIRRASA
jgi:hypothetical protein